MESILDMSDSWSRDDTQGEDARAVARMKKWAGEHPEADTQDLEDEEWLALAHAALTEGKDELAYHVVYWRHYSRYEKDMSQAGLKRLLNSYWEGDCSIESVNGQLFGGWLAEWESRSGEV